MKVRFAPSPTGLLHIGNIRTALVNWLYARQRGGTFLLRLDDTDAERSRREYEEAIREDMHWLGLSWDETARQSDRFDRYTLAKERLISEGRLYPCYETREELEFKRKLQLGRGQPPIYDRAALKLSDSEKRAFEKEGRLPHWRFLLNDAAIQWQDEVRGNVSFQARDLADPILIREDGVPTYTLSSVVDDGELGITHILRGEDHVSNTAVQVQVFEALGFSVPRFAHLALIKTKAGELSKREGGGDIRSLREAGYEPLAILSLLARIGTSDAIEARTSLDALVTGFDITKFGRAPAIYDRDELARLNHKLVSQLPYTAVRERIAQCVQIDASVSEQQGISCATPGEAFWLSVRGNLTFLSEINDWWQMCEGEVTPIVEDADFLLEAASLLPPEPWDDTTWKTWTEAVKTATGRKGKALFMPLRKALTGRDNGPELRALLPLIGREKALKRLQGGSA